MKPCPFLLALATVLVVGTGALRAHAGEAESRTLFAEARQLRQAGKCAEAIPLFRRALESYPEGLGSLRNIAECEEEIGRYATARRDYWDLRLAVLQTAQARYEGWDKQAEAAHKRLEAKVARVTIQVKGPASAQVYVNGRPLDPRLVGTELEMDLGATELTLRDGTASPPTQKLELKEGERRTVELESLAVPLDKVPSAPSGTPAATGASPARPSGPAATAVPEGKGAGLLVGGVVALGVAGAAGLGFGISLGVRQSALSDLEEVCPALDARPCAAPASSRGDAVDALERGRTASTLVTVFAIGGGVAASAGIGLMVASAVQGGSDEGSRDAVTLQIVPDVGGGHLLLRGSY